MNASRPLAIAVGITALMACDSLFRMSFTITTDVAPSASSRASDDALVAIRGILSTNALTSGYSNAKSEEWVWRDPENPPGIRVNIRYRPDGYELWLSQDLFGPIGRTKKYLAVSNSLREGLAKRFGADRVQVH